MTYIPEEAKVIYQSTDGKEEKAYDSSQWLAAMTSHVPNRGNRWCVITAIFGISATYSSVRVLPARARGYPTSPPTDLGEQLAVLDARKGVSAKPGVAFTLFALPIVWIFTVYLPLWIVASDLELFRMEIGILFIGWIPVILGACAFLWWR